MIRWFFRVTIALAQSIFMYNVKILDPQLYLKGPQTANHHIATTSKTSSKKPFIISLSPSSLVLNYVTSTSVFHTSILAPASPRHQPESGTQSQHIHISLYKRDETPKVDTQSTLTHTTDSISASPDQPPKCSSIPVFPLSSFSL